jgi:dienelactone hydrolase
MPLSMRNERKARASARLAKIRGAVFRTLGAAALVIAASVSVACAADLTLPEQAGAPTIYYSIVRPEGVGKVPVVIMLHGGDGLETYQRASFAQWAEWFKARKFASIVIDSFRGRGLSQFNYFPGQRDAYVNMLRQRATDLARTIEWLKTTDWADPSRLLIFGESQGAIVAGLAAVERSVRLPQIDMYLGCNPAYWNDHPPPKDYPPSLWLLGEQDGVTPPKACIEARKRMAELGGNADAIKLIVLPGAFHAFDFPGVNGTFQGVHVEYSASAVEASRNAIDQFLAGLGWSRS